MRRMKRAVCALLAAICLASMLPLRVGADAYTPRTVRVGVFDTAYFSEKQTDGSYDGILIDYLEQIAKYAGWKLEYVEGNLEEELEMLEDERVDLLGGIFHNSYISERYRYSDYSCGSSYTTINTLKSNTRLHALDYDAMQGIRIGVYSKAIARIASLEEFMQTNDLQAELVYYDSHTEFDRALGAGEVDAILTNDTSRRVDQRSIAHFNAIPYYFIVKKDQPDLLTELNRAMGTLLAVDSQFGEQVYERHVGALGLERSLSQEETDYVLNSPVLPVAVVDTQAPIAFSVDGQIRGLAPDLLKWISKLTGLQFAYVAVPDMDQARQMLHRGEVALVAGLCDGDTDGNQLTFTVPYLQSRDVLVKNGSVDITDGTVAALPKGDRHGPLPSGTQVLYCDSATECIHAVMSGKASFTILDSLVVDYYTYLRTNKKISVTPMAGDSSGLRFALAAPTDPNLISILDKTINKLSDEDMQMLLYANTTRSSANFTLTTLIYANPGAFVMGTGLVLGVLLLAAVLWLLFARTRLKLARETLLRDESYRIVSEMMDEHIFYFEYTQQEMSLSRQMAELCQCERVVSRAWIQAVGSEFLQFLLSIFWPPKSQQDMVTESACTLQDGEEVWFRVATAVIRDGSGKPMRGVGRISNIQQEMQEKQDLTDQAHTDFLTGLYNRQYSERLIQTYFEADQADHPGVLFVMDIDHFKQINDTLGHLGGDRVLIQFATLLAAEFGGEDVVGRWGGDEFIAYIRHAPDREQICARALRLCQRMNGEFEYENERRKLSISIGVACAADAETFSQLFQKADQALYQVKTTTRNGFRLCER